MTEAPCVAFLAYLLLLHMGETKNGEGALEKGFFLKKTWPLPPEFFYTLSFSFLFGTSIYCHFSKKIELWIVLQDLVKIHEVFGYVTFIEISQIFYSKKTRRIKGEWQVVILKRFFKNVFSEEIHSVFMYTVAGQSLSTGTYRTPPSNPLLPRLSGQKYGGYCPSLFLLTLNVFLICGKAYTETYQESKLERVAKIVFEPSIVLVERTVRYLTQF